LVVLCAVAQAYTRFEDGYADVVWNNLTGWSSYQSVKMGVEQGPDQLYGMLTNEYYDTRGTRLLYQYNTQGTTLGIGYRHWFPGKHFFGTVSVGEGVVGANAGRFDLRMGFAGYDAWEQEKTKRFTDLYGEYFYVGRASDTFASVRYRPGITLLKDETGRLWMYGVGQLWLSGTGENGTDNRLEVGPGIGYVYRGRVSFNFDLREGYVLRGTTTQRSYFNPTIVLAGNF